MREVISKGVISLYRENHTSAKLLSGRIYPESKDSYSAERFFIAHQVNDEGRRRNEEYFHERVVQTNEVHEEVEISDAEYN